MIRLKKSILKALLLESCLLLSFVWLGTGCTTVGRGVDSQMEALDLIDRGVGHLRDGELDRAAAAFATAWEIEPTSAALDGLGCVALRYGDARRAEELFRRATEHDPSYAEVWGNIALLYESRAESDESFEAFKLALKLTPASARIRNNFAALLFDARRWELAEAELLKAEVTEPHPVIVENLKFVKRKLINSQSGQQPKKRPRLRLMEN